MKKKKLCRALKNDATPCKLWSVIDGYCTRHYTKFNIDKNPVRKKIKK